MHSESNFYQRKILNIAEAFWHTTISILKGDDHLNVFDAAQETFEGKRRELIMGNQSEKGGHKSDHWKIKFMFQQFLEVKNTSLSVW